MSVFDEINNKISEKDDKIEQSLKQLQINSRSPMLGSPGLYEHGQVIVFTTEKLGLVVDKLNESSKKLENLTIILVIFTIVLSFLTLFLILNEKISQ